MIKANVVVEFPKWKKKIYNPEKYLQKKFNKLKKILKLKNKNLEFSILLTNNAKMKKLNNKFRKKNKITDVLSFPLKYTTIDREHKFTPLNSDTESTISEILQNTDVGQNYGNILGQSSKIPIILDTDGNTISFPPIINSALTTVTSETKNILVEVTGIDKQSAEDMLAVVTAVLENAGFEIYLLKISF